MPTTRQLRVWASRYVPAWVISTAATLLVVLAAQRTTHNAVVVALIGAAVEAGAYYATMLWRDVQTDRAHLASYGPRGFSRTALNLTLELGLAEAVDTFLMRPLLLFLATRLVADLTLAVAIGKLAADVWFLVPAIVVYEARQRGWYHRLRLRTLRGVSPL